MLKQRVITAIFLFLVLIAVFVFSYIPPVVSGFAALLSVLAVWELFHASGLDLKKPGVLLPLIGAALFALIFPFLPVGFPLVLTEIVFVLAVFAGGFALLKFGQYSLKNPLILLPIALIIPVLAGSVVYTRELDNGLTYLLLMCLSCFATDTGAYFIGRAFGKRKFSPRISPNKTVAGFVGGFVANTALHLITALILRFACSLSVSVWGFALLGLLCGFVDPFGDIVLSAVKRNFGVKDFGRLLPGHGGVLDRFDSFLFIGPFVYLFISLVNPLYI